MALDPLSREYLTDAVCAIIRSTAPRSRHRIYINEAAARILDLVLPHADSSQYHMALRALAEYRALAHQLEDQLAQLDTEKTQ